MNIINNFNVLPWAAENNNKHFSLFLEIIGRMIDCKKKILFLLVSVLVSSNIKLKYSSKHKNLRIVLKYST